MTSFSLRRHSVLELAQRCNWHRTHSEHVTVLCLNLFDELSPLHEFGPAERELIEYGSLLHDIGWHIAGKGHHKHSLSLILAADLPGFQRVEVQIIANIARYHRKSMPRTNHGSYQELSSQHRHLVDVGASLLRIADGLDRGHASTVRRLNCRIGEREIHCQIDTAGDVTLEIRGAARKMDLFERTFGRSISIRIADE